MDFFSSPTLFGGRGASYPSRFDAPKSSVVDTLPDAQTWMADWQARYDAEAARRGQGATTGGPSRDEFIRQQVGTVARQDAANPAYSPTLWQPNDAADLISFFNGNPRVEGGQTIGRDTQEQVWRHGLGNSLYDQIANYTPAAASAGYVPDFTALNAEKEKMTPLFAAQTRQQQAHDSMVGNNQQNGVIGAGYTDPNFGKINGDFGQSSMGAQANQQNSIDMSWTDGTYNPQGSGGGVYAGPSSRKTQWGLW